MAPRNRHFATGLIHIQQNITFDTQPHATLFNGSFLLMAINPTHFNLAKHISWHYYPTPPPTPNFNRWQIEVP